MENEIECDEIEKVVTRNWKQGERWGTIVDRWRNWNLNLSEH